MKTEIIFFFEVLGFPRTAEKYNLEDRAPLRQWSENLKSKIVNMFRI
jgi:hypothetical protein